MPFLSGKRSIVPEKRSFGSGPAHAIATLGGGFNSKVIGRCSNPACRSGWLHLFRRQTRPIFESGWTCAPECTQERLEEAVRRELSGWVPAQSPHRHRIPLGLLMLEKGWIDSQQLRRALNAQTEAGRIRVGEWLIAQGATDEATVSRALAAQWGCPVLLASERSLQRTSLVPRLFLQEFGALMVEVPGRSIFYLGFEQNVDTALAFSIERMTGVRTECGIVPTSAFNTASRLALTSEFPGLQMAEAVSPSAAAHVLAKTIERNQPVQSRLVRTHEWLWLRMFLEPGSGQMPHASSVKDLLCRVGPLI